MAQNSVKLALSGAVSRFLDSNDLTDFKITCQKATWNVHRLLLCLHSDVFVGWCTGDAQEAKDGKANLSEYEIPYVDALIKYLYTFDYNTDGVEPHSDRLKFHISMCVLAGQFDLTGLNYLAYEKFRAIVGETILSSEIAQAFLVSLRALETTWSMRQSLVSLVIRKRETFLPIVATTDSKSLEDILRQHPDFALEVIKGRPGDRPAPIATPAGAVVKPRQCIEKDYVCPSCKGIFKAHLGTSKELRYDCPTCNWYAHGAAWNSQYLKRY